MQPAEVQARRDAAYVYAREFKDAARELRRAAIALLEVADRCPGNTWLNPEDDRPGGFCVIIPTAPEAVARLRELAELSCDIVFKETVDAEPDQEAG
jgi:hypothetical protein